LDDVALVFGRNDEWTLYEIAKTIICAILLLPFRLCVVIATVVLYSLLARIATIGLSEESLLKRPLHKTRRKLVELGCILGRICLFGLGFWKIKVVGKHLLRSNYPRMNIYIANHTSWIDILAFLCTTNTVPSFVAKKSIKAIPLLGYDSQVWQCIYVDRLSHREGVSSTLKERATNFEMPPVVVFPEGTTSNGKQLIKFHTGGFLSGAPVRPVVLRYPYKHFSPAWESISAIKHIFRLLTQFSNNLEITFLPIYVPTANEKSNPELYAKNVQKIMADALNVPIKDYSYQAKVQYLRTIRNERTSVY